MLGPVSAFLCFWFQFKLRLIHTVHQVILYSDMVILQFQSFHSCDCFSANMKQYLFTSGGNGVIITGNLKCII